MYGSILGFTSCRRTGCGCAAPVRLPSQVGAGDDPGQDAQPIAQCLTVFRRVGRRYGPGVGAGAGIPPILVVVLSHPDPPPVAGDNRSPDRSLPSSVISGATGGNPLWGGSPVNQDSCVNYPIRFPAPRPGDDVIDVYKDLDLGRNGSGSRFRS